MAARRGASDPASEHLVDTEVVAVLVRRGPRYERLLLVGVVAGLLAALAMTGVAALTEAPGGPLSTGLSGLIWVFGVYAAVFVGAGLLVMGVLAIVLGSRSKRRRSARARHETTLVHDTRAPTNDDAPRWAVQADDLAPQRREPPLRDRA
jgi:hypothetical protein